MNKIKQNYKNESISIIPESTLNKKEIHFLFKMINNVPTLILFIFGTIIMAQLNIVNGIIFFIYLVFSIIWFWAKICPYCKSFNTNNCPCGYGILSAKLFKKKSDKEFKQIFKKNILILFPAWFAPLIAGIYILLKRFSYITMFFLITFCLIGFFVIPFISLFAGCKSCSIKMDCPWYKRKLKT